MEKKLSANSIYNYIVIVLLLIAVAIRGGATFEWLQPSETPVYTLNDVKKAFPNATSFEKERDNSFVVKDKNSKQLGYVLISEELKARHSGYGGNTPLLIALNMEKHIIGTYLLSHNETAEYIDHVNDVNLLNTWNSMPMDTTILSKQVDAVTGATKSSEAIIYTFEKTASKYLELEHQSRPISVLRIIQILLFFTLLFLSLSMSLKKRFTGFYTYYLLLVFLVMGIWLKKIISLDLIANSLTKGLSWQGNWELISILILAIAMSILGHRKYYCNYLCPMGALQTLASKISPFKKRSFAFKISNVALRNIYLCFIWASLLLGFTLPLAQMEPFIAFSFKIASWTMLSFGMVIIILSLFFNRPWCQLCPTGCLLDSVPSLKTNRK